MRLKTSVLIFIFLIILPAALFYNFDISKKTSTNNYKPKTEKSINIKTIVNNEIPFEGVVELVQKNLYDTNRFTFYVTNNKIRVYKNPNQKSKSESLVFNLKNETITALNDLKKQYYKLPIKPIVVEANADYKIIKTNNYKKIIGYNCSQWRVKNNTKNTEITYWVVGKKYDFYKKLLKLWNKTENCYKYFLTIPDVDGYIPLCQVERTLLRDVKSTITITKIKEQKVDTNLFNVPNNYSLFTN